MIERKIFQEIPKKADFHSVVMTTFAFDFHHFESQVLKVLKAKGITNINIFVDDNMLNESLGCTTGNLKYVSKSYSINSLSSKGVFHPKLILLVGENDICLIQGSGNITNGGHGKNHELFNAFYASKDNLEQLPLIVEAWDYLKGLTKSIAGFSSNKLNWVSANCSLLTNTVIEKHKFHQIDESFSAALVYNETGSSIWNQVSSLIPKNVTSIDVFSPFYDEKGTLLQNILNHYQPNRLKVFLQNDKGLHPYKMDVDSRLQFFDWNSTKRASESIRHFDRKLHSKVFVFNTDTSQYCLLGSANATIQAFGTIDYRGANDEFGVLLKLENRNILEELDLVGNYKQLKPKNIKVLLGLQNEQENVGDKNYNKIKILGADLDGKNLTLFIENKLKLKGSKLSIYDIWGDIIYADYVELSTDKIRIELKALKTYKNLAFVLFLNSKDELISNKQMINSLHDLWNTNPSIENRKLLKLSSLIETGKNGVFDVISFFNTIVSNRPKISKTEVSSQQNGDTKEQVFSNLTYEEALAYVKVDDSIDKIALQHHSVKIWDAIERYFNELVAEKETVEMDDEEEGTAEVGRTRINTNEENETVFLNSKKVLEQRQLKIVKFLANYKQAITNALTNDSHKISVIDFAMYLIVLKHLLELVNKEVALKIKEGDTINEKLVLYNILGGFNQLNNYSGGLMGSVGSFINLLCRFPLHNPDDEFLSNKQEHYLNLARNTTLFALAISKNVYKNHPNGAKWLDIVALNILNKLGVPNMELTKFFEALVLNVSIENIQVSELVKHANEWVAMFNLNNLQSKYLVDDNYGICDIVKMIPKENTKFLKIARPGFTYNEQMHDFVLERVYCLEKKMLMSSFQKT